MIKLEGFPPIEVTIVNNIKHDMILGDDVLRHGNCKLNYKERILVLFDNIYKLKDNDVRQIDEVSLTCGYEEVDQVVAEYADVFSNKGQPIGECKVASCQLPTGNAEPITQKAYRTPFSKHQIVEEKVQEMLNSGVIHPSTSPWVSPIALVPKKDGSTRFCIDYRKVNQVIIKDRYPLLVIQDIINKFNGAALFTTPVAE